MKRYYSVKSHEVDKVKRTKHLLYRKAQRKEKIMCPVLYYLFNQQKNAI